MPVVGYEQYDAECYSCRRTFGPKSPGSLEQNTEYTLAIPESARFFPKTSIVSFDTIAAFVVGWKKFAFGQMLEEELKKACIWAGPLQRRVLKAHIQREVHTVANTEGRGDTLFGLGFNEMPVNGLIISPVPPITNEHNMLNIEASQIANLTVKREADRNTIRKIDAIPLIKPDDWIDPYPDAELNDVVMVVLFNRRVIVTGTLPLDLKPQPFALVYGGIRMEFAPVGKWEGSNHNGSQFTSIEGIHYDQPEPPAKV